MPGEIPERGPPIGRHEYSALNLHMLSSSSFGPLTLHHSLLISQTARYPLTRTNVIIRLFALLPCLYPAPSAVGVINYANSAVVSAKLSTVSSNSRCWRGELKDVDAPYFALVNKASSSWKLLGNVNTLRRDRQSKL